MLIGGHPRCRRCSRRNRDSALLLLLHPVHRRCTIVHFADFVRLAGVVKDRAPSCGLAGVNVRHDAIVAVVSKECCVPCGYSLWLGVASGGHPALKRLPAVVRERLVRFAIRCVSSRFLTASPRLLAASSSSSASVPPSCFQRGRAMHDEPADSQRLRPLGANLDRHLVGRTTDTARAHLDCGRTFSRPRWNT